MLLLITQASTQSVYHEDHGNLSVVDSSTLSCPGLWSIFENANGSTRCTCGSNLGGVVQCNDEALQVQLLPCYCMTPYAKDPNMTVVGACLISTCISGGASFYYPVPSNITVGELSYFMCNSDQDYELRWRNRDGQLCGKCKEDFAPPVYSYDRRCVKCLHSGRSIINSIKYCAIATNNFLYCTGYPSHQCYFTLTECICTSLSSGNIPSANRTDFYSLSWKTNGN